jgi:hypothetical protein
VVRSNARTVLNTAPALSPPMTISRPLTIATQSLTGLGTAGSWVHRPVFGSKRGYAAGPNDAEAGVAPSNLIGRSSCCTLLLQKSNAQMQHQVTCSNSCWWTYAGSTSGRRS